jgi:2-isopropylmalate synthase
MITRVRADRAPFTTRIDARELFGVSQLLTELTGEAVQANKAIVGRNAFAHEAGIHQDGVLKDRRTYEIMRPEDVGVPQSTLVLGKHSGRHAVARRCEDLGHALTRFEIDRVYRQMIALADRQKGISDDDLAAIVAGLKAPEAGRESAPAQGLGPALRRARSPRVPAADAADYGYGHGA